MPFYFQKYKDWLVPGKTRRISQLRYAAVVRFKPQKGLGDKSAGHLSACLTRQLWKVIGSNELIDGMGSKWWIIKFLKYNAYFYRKSADFSVPLVWEFVFFEVDISLLCKTKFDNWLQESLKWRVSRRRIHRPGNNAQLRAKWEICWRAVGVFGLRASPSCEEKMISPHRGIALLVDGEVKTNLPLIHRKTSCSCVRLKAKLFL